MRPLQKNMSLMHEYRCTCGKLLFKGLVLGSTVEIKCRRCQEISTVQGFGWENSKNEDRCVFAILDRNGRILSIGNDCARLFGFSDTELLGKSIKDLCLGATEDFFKKYWNESFKTESFVGWDCVVISKEGKEIPSRIRLKYFKLGKDDCALCSVCANYLIPKKTQGGAELVSCSSQDRFSQANFCAEIDRCGEITFICNKLAHSLGRKEEDMLGSNLFGYLRLEVGATNMREFEELIKTGTSFKCAHGYLIHKDGLELPVESYFMPTYSPLGILAGYKYFGWLKNDLQQRQA